MLCNPTGHSGRSRSRSRSPRHSYHPSYTLSTITITLAKQRGVGDTGQGNFFKVFDEFETNSLPRYTYTSCTFKKVYKLNTTLQESNFEIESSLRDSIELLIVPQMSPFPPGRGPVSSAEHMSQRASGAMASWNSKIPVELFPCDATWLFRSE